MADREVDQAVDRTIIEGLFKEQVLKDYKLAKEGVKNRHNSFIRYLEAYCNIDNKDRADGMSRSKVPVIQEAVNVLKADILDKVFQTDLNIDSVGREYSDHQFAALIRDLIKYQTYTKCTKEELSDTVFSFLLYGNAPAKVYYAEDYGTTTEHKPIMDGLGQVVDTYPEKVDYQIYRGPVTSTVDIFDFLPHPDKKKVNDDLPIIQRFYPDESELVARQREGVYQDVELVLEYMLENESAPRDKDGMQNKKKRRELIGGKFDEHLLSGNPECLEWQGKFDIDGDGIKENVIGVVAMIEDTNPDSGDTETSCIILRLEESPYNDNQNRYLWGRMFRLPNEIWGIGFGRMLEMDEATATSLLRAMLDSYYRVARPRTYVRDDAVTDESELEVPWGVVHVNDDENPIGDVIQEQMVQPIGADGYNLLNLIKYNAQTRSGVDDMKAGRTPGQKATATASAHAFNQSSVRFKDILWMFESSVVIPMCDKYHAINQQFIDKPYVIYILGEQGVYWNEVSPQQIAGKVNFISLASTKEADRQVNIEQIMSVLQIAVQNPMLMTTTPLLFIQLLEEFRFRNIESYKKAIGYDVLMFQIQQAGQMQITPQQMLQMQGILYQQPMPGQQGGNTNPYGSPQENPPGSQEELMAKVNQGMTQNFPVAR